MDLKSWLLDFRTLEIPSLMRFDTPTRFRHISTHRLDTERTNFETTSLRSAAHVCCDNARIHKGGRITSNLELKSYTFSCKDYFFILTPNPVKQRIT